MIKKIGFLLLLTGAGSYSLHAQKNLTAELRDPVRQVETSEDLEVLRQAASRLEQLTGTYQDRWLPAYYLSYAYVRIGQTMGEDKGQDAQYEKALKVIQKADERQPNHSEVHAMWAYIYQRMLLVEAAKRGVSHSGKANEHIQLAKQLDSSNPRPYFLKANHLLRVPKQFGGGKEKACRELQQALLLYEQQGERKEMRPHWGQEEAQELKKKRCAE